MIDFSTNTNQYIPRSALLARLKQHVRFVLDYPDNRNLEIVSLLGDFLRVPAENISLGVGSTQFFSDIPRFLEYDRAVIPVPTFWEYGHFNEQNGKAIYKIVLDEADRFAPDYEKIRSSIRSGDCVFLCNVNNPTSVLYEKERLLRLVAEFPEATFVVDETYLLFRSDFESQTLSDVVTRSRNLLVVMSLSKFFSLPGIRLGIMISDVHNRENYMNRFHIPYSVNPLAAPALRGMVDDPILLEDVRIRCEASSRDLFDLLTSRLSGRLECFRPQGNFLLAKIVTGQCSENIHEALIGKGICVRGGHELPDMDSGWLRFAALSAQENRILVDGLDAVLSRPPS